MADSLVVVYSASGHLEAEMVKMFLNSEGIPAESFQESYGITLGLTFGELGKADIMVPFEYEARARKLISEMEKDIIAKEEDEPSDNNPMDPDDQDEHLDHPS